MPELAAGTGLIAKQIVNTAAHIEATDASAEMIFEVKRDNHSAKPHFSVRDMFCPPYAATAHDIQIHKKKSRRASWRGNEELKHEHFCIWGG